MKTEEMIEPTNPTPPPDGIEAVMADLTAWLRPLIEGWLAKRAETTAGSGIPGPPGEPSPEDWRGRVAAEIVELRRLADRDDEAAHAREDALREYVLKGIAEGRIDDPAEAARMAMTTSEIHFGRWFG